MDMNRMRMANRNRQMQQRLNNRGMGSAPAPAGQGAIGLQQKFSKGVSSAFTPGNIGEINNVIWPFAFRFQPQDIIPGQSLIQSFSVTQEAGFIMRSISQQTFKKDGFGNYSYVDPFAVDEGANAPNGLVFALKDAQSTRDFNGRTLQEIADLGNANFPTVYPSSIFLLPNQTMQISLTNSNPTDTFFCFVTVWGYRVRIQDGQNILSTISG